MDLRVESQTPIDNSDDIWDMLCMLQVDDNQSSADSFSPPHVDCVNKYCNGDIFDVSDTHIVCTKCGTLQHQNMDYSAEWRYYGADDNKSSNPTRCGMPTSTFLPKSSLGTVIGTESSNRNFMQIARIRKYQMWNSMPYRERSLYTVMTRLNLKACTGGIPASIIDDAKAMYKQISETKISRGENRNGLIASTLYMACKNNKVPRSAKEIASIFNIPVTTMTKGCKKFHEIMRVNVCSTAPKDFIVRFCSKLQRPDIVEECLKIVSNADKYSIVSENAPPSIAAGSIYLCCVLRQHAVSKKDIAKACQISEVTINKCFKKLYNYRKYLLLDENDSEILIET